MCVVSAISDHYREKPWYEPVVKPYDPTPVIPIVITREPNEAEILKKILELIEKARELDKITGEPDCEDPKKTKWITEVEKRLDKLEKKDDNTKTKPKRKMPAKHKDPRTSK